MIKAANQDNKWTESVYYITIIMPTPFWMRTWFKITSISFVVFIVLLVYFLRTRAAKRMEQRLLKIVRERTYELQEANEELYQQKEQISIQKEELEKHRENLEELVKIRTIDLEAAKRRAEQSDNLKSAFLANMSHEIRTPLNAILGFSDLLTTDALPLEEMPSINKIIHTNGQSLLQLINDIMDVSMIEANQISINKYEFKLRPFFCNVFKEFEVVFNKETHENLKLKVSISNDIDENYTINSNELRIKQILQNLFGNAAKFTNKGDITIGCKTNNLKNEIIFFVKDTGIGIAEEYKEFIFDRFRKIEYSAEQIHRGTGLGLSISRDICHLLGGKIWVESQEGKGSTFFFTIPV